MTEAEAQQLLSLPLAQAVQAILTLADKAEKYDQLVGTVSPTTPSGMTPVYLKPAAPLKRKKRPGRKKGHTGVGRRRSAQVDQFRDHTLTYCPHCQTPVKKPIQQYQSVICRFPISAGGLTQAWKNLAFLLESRYQDYSAQIARSGVLHADETGWRLNGRTHWLWCFATPTLCYYLITPGRGSPVIRQVLGQLFPGILICDFWGAYNKISALAKQRCFFHLFTELAKVDKANRSLAWKAFRKTLTRLLKDAVRLSEHKTKKLPEDYSRLTQRLRQRLAQLLETENHDRDVRRLLKRLKRHRNELFTFLDHENVSPYNNHAEQQMRKPVLTRKVSQQNRSDQGAKTQAILMTLFRTAELQGENPLEAILALTKSFIHKKSLQGVNLKLAA